ncbi:MAG: hypothetical protein HYY17_02720 [Planctomycetes bacterium]|nr:hypothetical protein [Planctomycetota bacterium]
MTPVRILLCLLFLPGLFRGTDEADDFVKKVVASTKAVGDKVAAMNSACSEIDTKIAAGLDCYEGWDPKYLGPIEKDCEGKYNVALKELKGQLAKCESPDKLTETAKKKAFFKKAEKAIADYRGTHKNATSISGYTFKTSPVIIDKVTVLYKRLKECVEGGEGEEPGGREYRLSDETEVYRVYGGKANRVGRWFFKDKPKSAVGARKIFALPGGNHAKKMATILLPPGTKVRESKCAALYGEPGGGTQILCLDPLETKWWQSDAGLPLK